MTTLILTHEQADFDAVASVWAAHRLHPAALPVLPRRVNRNVRAFFTLYGQHFTFTHAEDLPRRPVAHVIVVDAQSASSVKGMSPKTGTTIIDHHDSSAATVGANITLLVEQISSETVSLSPIEATLFLLGLYEDTGSLSYLTTTPRDVRAAAFLLEQGAQLDTVREFLQHPLTPGQQALFDQILTATEAHTINGQSIIIAAIDGGNTDEELSYLAHKLRDTFEAAAVFLLVALSGHEARVQFIARSTSVNVDVAAIATRFHGGGHSRAAAAIIRNQTLAEARNNLLACLTEHVLPATTVAEIMSRGVQTLEPLASILEAAERMKRYGYEGYPIVKDGRVLGLITRRAVDRALNHRLEAQPVSSIMEAGQVSVAPNDSIEHLQRVMTSHGWGQVPVLEDGNIVGIVTRTDLLKRLASPSPARFRHNVSEQLASALPAEQVLLLQQISRLAAQLNISLFIVGGFVRDLIVGHPSMDFDLVVEGDAIALARRVAAALGGRVVAHHRFGTAKWKLPPNAPLAHLDFVSARTEFYPHPSALPEVEHASIKLDLHRRDFTINTLALSLNQNSFGDVLDFWGGERDLRDKLIRVLHSISFVDDATRILRAVRFEQRFGFSIEPRTLELLQAALPLMRRVSGDRLRHEFELILAEADPARHLIRCAQLGVLDQIYPDLSANGDIEGLFANLQSEAPSFQSPLARWSAWLATVPASSLEPVLARLNISTRLGRQIQEVSALRIAFTQFKPNTPFSELHTVLETFDNESLQVAVALFAEDALREHLLEYIHRLASLKPATTGEDLKALGLQPGPRYGEILSQLKLAYLDGQIKNPDEERAMLSTLVTAA